MKQGSIEYDLMDLVIREVRGMSCTELTQEAFQARVIRRLMRMQKDIVSSTMHTKIHDTHEHYEMGYKNGFQKGFNEAQHISREMCFESYRNGKMAGTIETEMKYHDERKETESTPCDQDDRAGTCDSPMVESGTERTVDSEDAPIFRQHDYDTYLNGNQGWRFTDGSGRKPKWLRPGAKVKIKRSRNGSCLGTLPAEEVNWSAIAVWRFTRCEDEIEYVQRICEEAANCTENEKDDAES